MPSDRLFAGPDFHSVLEHYKAKLVEAYEQLSDEEAVDEHVQSNLKKQFMLDVPVLRPQGEIWAEEGVAKVDVRRLPNRMPGLGDRPIYEDVPQFTVHVPFDDDPGVFGISPSIFGGTSVSGEIVGNELLLTFLMVMPGQDLQGNIDNTIRRVNSTLSHLREQTLVFDQGLIVALAQAVMLRKQRIQMRSGAIHNLRIPIRSAPVKKIVSAEPVRRQAAAKTVKSLPNRKSGMSSSRMLRKTSHMSRSFIGRSSLLVCWFGWTKLYCDGATVCAHGSMTASNAAAL
jgi:hypothetical protein